MPTARLMTRTTPAAGPKVKTPSSLAVMFSSGSSRCVRKHVPVNPPDTTAKRRQRLAYRCYKSSGLLPAGISLPGSVFDPQLPTKDAIIGWCKTYAIGSPSEMPGSPYSSVTRLLQIALLTNGCEFLWLPQRLEVDRNSAQHPQSHDCAIYPQEALHDVIWTRDSEPRCFDPEMRVRYTVAHGETRHRLFSTTNRVAASNTRGERA